jgi:hypothetical protein
VSLQKKLTAADSYEKLEKILDRHTKQAPPYSLLIFSEAQKQKILNHSHNIYKFFLMYEISLTKFVDYNILTHEPFQKMHREPKMETGTLISKQPFISNFFRASIKTASYS